jgi:hypothetical protein
MKPPFNLMFCFFSACMVISHASTPPEDPHMYLCTDSMAALKTDTGPQQEKLVYGYLHGEKTPCMSEYELRVRLSEEQFNRDKKTVPDPHPKPSKQAAVYRGEKHLANADLRGFDLKGLDLSGADLENANLESADLRGAKLTNANLKGANLEYAYCKRTDFTRANMAGTRLTGAYFQYANLLETDSLSIDDLVKASTLYKTLLEKTVMEVIVSRVPAKLKQPSDGWKQKVFSEQEELPKSEQADPHRFH